MREFDIHIIDKDGFVDVIKRKTQPKSKSKGGAESVFIPLTKTIAIKGFMTRGLARASMRRQKKAAKHGLAPKVIVDEVFEVLMPVGGTFLGSRTNWSSLRRAPNYKGKHRRLYAYKTEIVPKVYKSASRSLSIKDKAKYEALQTELLSHGFNVGDLHNLNIGIMNDKMVCFDFGDLSS